MPGPIETPDMRLRKMVTPAMARNAIISSNKARLKSSRSIAPRAATARQTKMAAKRAYLNVLNRAVHPRNLFAGENAPLNRGKGFQLAPRGGRRGGGGGAGRHISILSGTDIGEGFAPSMDPALGRMAAPVSKVGARPRPAPTPQATPTPPASVSQVTSISKPPKKKKLAAAPLRRQPIQSRIAPQKKSPKSLGGGWSF